MKLKFPSILFILLLAQFISCGNFETVEVLAWKNVDVTLKVDGGNATTSFYWKIYVKEKGDLSDHLIFESYSNPYLLGISISGDTLSILCLKDRNLKTSIAINLNELEHFVDEPIRYQRNVLLNTNRSYDEPSWIVEQRALDEKYNLK